MKKLIGIIIFLLIVTLCYFVQQGFGVNGRKNANTEPSSPLPPQTQEAIDPADTFVERSGTFSYNEQNIRYLLIFPARYTQTANRWPMILFLHGSSLRGQNVALVKEYGPTWVAERRADFPLVVLAPQCAEGEDWVNKTDILAALLDEVLRKYRIDPDKVYLTGTSMGGRGTWSLACRHPEYFAAIAPLAAAKPVIPTTWHEQMLSMPVWAFHGDKDTVAPLKDDEAIITALRSQGGTPRLTILPDRGHNIAGIYKNQELYDWFLANTRTHRQ